MFMHDILHPLKFKIFPIGFYFVAIIQIKGLWYGNIKCNRKKNDKEE